MVELHKRNGRGNGRGRISFISALKVFYIIIVQVCYRYVFIHPPHPRHRYHSRLPPYRCPRIRQKKNLLIRTQSPQLEEDWPVNERLTGA
jgi:hypothetical protein